MTVTSTNPATGESRTLDVEETSAAEVRALAERARDAALDYATRPLTWRAQMLRAMADELESDGENLVALANEETALGLPRLQGELRRTAFQLRFFAEVITDGAFLDATIDHAKDSPMGPLPDLRRVRVPIGAVAVFGSSNFPFAFSVPGGDTASALASGCAVVVKAHPAHPATSRAAFEALRRGASKSEALDGVVNIVFGFDAGVALVEAPAISAVGFTGSVPAGRALWERANARATPIPFFGELGAANPLVVTEAAATVRGAEIGAGFAGSMTLGVGQFCTKPGLFFVPVGEHGDVVVSSLVETLEQLGTFTMLTSGIAEHFRTGTTAMRRVSEVRALVHNDHGSGAQSCAQLFEVDARRFAAPDASPLREECFGPVALVVRFESSDELRSALSASDPALTFSLFAERDDPDAAWLIDVGARQCGRFIMNGFPTGVGVSWSMQHGGPWPSTTSPSTTSVGAAAIERWLRPVTYQAVPDGLLPESLREDNPLGIPRRVDGVLT